MLAIPRHNDQFFTKNLECTLKTNVTRSILYSDLTHIYNRQHRQKPAIQ